MAEDHVPCRNEFLFHGLTMNEYTKPHLLEKAVKFEFRSSDVLLATFPRSGTTLTQEIIWQIINSDIIEKDVKYPNIDDRFPFLEFNNDFYSPELPNPIDTLSSMTEQRLIKTHIPYFLLREQFEKVNAKLVVVMRNPKDNATSMFHFYHLLHNFEWNGSWSDFLNIFLRGKTFSGDFFTNNIEWWSLRDRHNVLILRYEDLLQQPHQEIRKIASFLGYNLSPEKVDLVAHNTSFAVMSKNEFTNFKGKGEDGAFIRKGKFGEWKSLFTVKQNEIMDRYITERLEGTGLHFFYD